jgi:hypothetical protein
MVIGGLGIEVARQSMQGRGSDATELTSFLRVMHCVGSLSVLD